MIDKIKSSLTTAFLLFVFDFGTPEGKADPEMFDYQRNAQKVRMKLGKDGFRQATACYFNQFQTADGIDYHRLDELLLDDRKKKVMVRYLGKDKIMYLTLIVNVMKSIQEKPKRRGLLGAA